MSDKVDAVMRRHAVDAPAAVGAAAFLVMLGQMISNMQPVVLGAIAADYHFDDSKVGLMGATFVGSLTLVAMAAPLWVRQVDWRRFSFMSAAAFGAVFCLGSLVSSAILVVGLFALLGALSAAVGAPAFAALGDSAHPDRNYSIATIVQAIAAAAMVAPLMGYVVPTYGAPGMCLSMGGAALLGVVASRWMPRRGTTPPDVARPEARRAFSHLGGPAVMILVGIGLFSFGMTGFWFYVERIGESNGVSPQTIGLTLSVCSILTIVSSAVVVWLSEKIPSIWFITFGSLALGLAMVLVVHRPVWHFVVANIILSLGFGLAQPCFWAYLRRHDGTGRLFVAAPAASGMAAVFAGLVSGVVIGAVGYSGLMNLCAAAEVAAVVLAWFAGALGHRLFTDRSARTS